MLLGCKNYSNSLSLRRNWGWESSEIITALRTSENHRLQCIRNSPTIKKTFPCMKTNRNVSKNYQKLSINLINIYFHRKCKSSNGFPDEESSRSIAKSEVITSSEYQKNRTQNWNRINERTARVGLQHHYKRQPSWWKLSDLHKKYYPQSKLDESVRKKIFNFK